MMRKQNPKHYLALVILCLFSISLIFTKCNRKEYKTLAEALIAGCGDYKVFLSTWYSQHESSEIKVDPLGGKIYMYWIDETGCACHGEPGVSGQLGPAVIDAYNPESLIAANEGRIISLEQMEELQEISFNMGDYKAKGMHFVQFNNIIWRYRESGEVLDTKDYLHFSIPSIVSLDNKFCLAPLTAAPFVNCGISSISPIPDSIEVYTGQHPTKCKKRMQPISLEMTNDERLNYCLLLLENGLSVTEY